MPPSIVSEYCSRGSLADVLRSGRTSPAAAAQLDWPRRLNMLLDTAKGMVSGGGWECLKYNPS